MLTILPLLFSLGAQTEAARPQADPAPYGYVMFASGDEGRCGYSLQDVVGMNARQLKETLANGRDPSKGLQILTDRTTPPACAPRARRVAAKLGFKPIFIRPATDLDRGGGGIPGGDNP